MLIAMLIGMCSWVYVVILCSNGMILNNWRIFIEANLPEWMARPIATCEYCNGGQLSLWLYLYYYVHDYSFFGHIAFICATIFTIKTLNKLFYGN